MDLHQPDKLFCLAPARRQDGVGKAYPTAGWLLLSNSAINISVMPLTWTIDPYLKLVTAVAEGEVTRREFDALLDELRAADAHGYRKLFDGGRGETTMGPADILALGVRMRAEHRTGPMGPLAVVMPEKYATLVGPILGMLASAKRPMRVFANAAPARRWLESLAPTAPIEPGSPDQTLKA